MIEFCHVTAGYGGVPAVRDVSLHIPRGKITAVIGPNGCGKTTLLRAAVRQLPLSGGEILMDGRSVSDYGRKEFARAASFMPQVRTVPSITVGGLVAHGRFPHLGLSRQLRQADRAAVERIGLGRPGSAGAFRRRTAAGVPGHGSGPGDRGDFSG